MIPHPVINLAVHDRIVEMCASGGAQVAGLRETQPDEKCRRPRHVLSEKTLN